MKDKYCVISFEVPRKIHIENRMVIAMSLVWSGVGEGMSNFLMGIEFQFFKMKRALDIGYTTK